jgi:hypothetical protein
VEEWKIILFLAFIVLAATAPNWIEFLKFTFKKASEKTEDTSS